MSVVDSKKERSELKRKITLVAKRIAGSIQRGNRNSVITGFYQELESLYADFLTVDEEYVALVTSSEEYAEHMTVSGLSLEEYKQDITDIYAEAKQRYDAHQANLDDPIIGNQVLTKMQEQLENLDIIINNHINTCRGHASDSSANSNVAADTITISQAIHTNSSCSLPSTINNSAPNETTQSTNTCSEVLNSANSSLSNDARHPTNPRPMSVIPNNNSITDVSPDVLNTLNPEELSAYLSGINSPISLSNNIHGDPRQLYSGLHSNPLQPSVVSSSLISSSVNSTDHSRLHFPYNTVTASNPYLPSLSASVLSQGTTGLPPLHPITSLTQAPIVPPVESHSTSRIGYNHNLSQVHLPHTVSHNHAFLPVDQAVASMSPSVTSSLSQSNLSYNPMHASRYKFAKFSIPTFDGSRARWPEFKNAWTELVVPGIPHLEELAFRLRESVTGGEAKRIVNTLWITKKTSYQVLWQRLCDHYDDVSAAVESCFKSLSELKPVKEHDCKALLLLIDQVENIYLQLVELQMIQCFTMVQVDRVCMCLPFSMSKQWLSIYHDLPQHTKLQPFPTFMAFLSRERSCVSRMAEIQTWSKPSYSYNKEKSNSHHTDAEIKNIFYDCAVHKKEGTKHETKDCQAFQKLTIEDKLAALRSVRACFRCFKNHHRRSCEQEDPCCHCGDTRHHSLLCKKLEVNSSSDKESTESHLSRRSERGILAIQQASVAGYQRKATVMMDNCADSSYITFDAARRFQARKLEGCTLEVTTTGGKRTEFKSAVYSITLVTQEGKEVEVRAYGLERISNKLSPLNMKVIQDLFPGLNISTLQRQSSEVDILLGNTLYGVHPKNEIATAGNNLSIMMGAFGMCIVGYHPSLDQVGQLNSHMVSVLHQANVQASVHYTYIQHRDFTRPSHKYRCETSNINHDKTVAHITQSQCAALTKFIQGEELGTDLSIKCGSCKCGKCPISGHTYSFAEEQELKLIQEGLRYVPEDRCWVSSYPWKKNPATLPNNYSHVYACLKSCERSLGKDPVWGEVYNQQIDDMLERKVSRLVSQEELAEWKGPVFYISHMAVKNPKSESTPVRIVYNSSQICDGESLNGALFKGPDAYMNNLLGILLRWRERKTAIVGDIKKMFNSVHLELPEQHCHRYLWRHLDTSREPDVYVMTRVNIGDRPSGSISTEALYMTADKFQSDNPEAAAVLKRSTYVDDILESISGSVEEAHALAQSCQEMLDKGGFRIKHWIFSGEKRAGDDLRVLGVGWRPQEDRIFFKISLNFSAKRQGVHVEPDLTQDQVPASIPLKLTRRIVLSQVQKLYDPLGFLTPVTLLAKVYLRETWSLKLSWDDPLPVNLSQKWIRYFTQLFEIEKFEYDRCLHPENSIGDPMLVVMSDGSDLSYGFTAYIRWSLSNGEFLCRLIMAKSRIAPLNKLSTPQMELNGAVLSKRGRSVIEKELRQKFSKVLHLVDSETVLSMIKKVSHRFKLYEGVRIGEIQAATEGDMSSWAWLPGSQNISDWATRCKSPQDIGPESSWFQGPSFLYLPEEEWKLKFTCNTPDSELSPGEKKSVSSHMSLTDQISSFIDYNRYSKFTTIVWIITRILEFLSKTKKPNKSVTLANLYKQAEVLILKNIQESMKSELTKTDKKGRTGGCYASLRPVMNNDNLWVIGTRISSNPMTLQGCPQILLPYSHPGTKLLMRRAHMEATHKGRDSTLSRFRFQYWTPHGSKLAQQVKNQCPLCKLRDRILINQQMGPLPLLRLKPAPAFCNTMVDIFGPFAIRGEVQKRTSGKGYGIIFTDLCSRAVHIEAAFGYDTQSFLLAFTRFISIRGYPSHMFSDPGSQLVAADIELREAWKSLNHNKIQHIGAENGMIWHFGPADSSWYQGAVESLISGVKRSMKFTMSKNFRLSSNEFMTVCYEVANVLNERPLGTCPSTDSLINILTPNCLLLGRAVAKNPTGWQPSTDIKGRFTYTQQVADEFWKHWTDHYIPTLVHQQKWHTACRNLQIGDVVVVGDGTFKGDYRLARVVEASPGEDGLVRRVSLAYKNYRVGEKIHEYKGCKDTVVTRGVRRLSLVVPVEQLE